ncbi:MAG: RNA polymerase sigma factor [Ruminococcus sp.]|nr:RNA polymerase sigma factor [Ruminococcus sp.]
MACSELVMRLKRKDQSALEELIRKYNAYVAAITYTILQGHLPEIDIQGVINQVFFRLWEHAENLHMEKDEEIKPYIGAVARNAALNEKKKIISSMPLEEEILGEFTDSFSQVELRKLLLDALKELSTENQVLLLKFYFQGKTIRQISEEEQQPISTIKTKLRRSREKLRFILEKGGYTYEA